MDPHRTRVPRLFARVSPAEWTVAALVACVAVVLVIVEPKIVSAPFESPRAIATVVLGTAIAAVAYVAMLRWRVPPVVRILVLGIPFLVTSYWLIAPHFRDTVVRDRFAVSIADARRASTTTTVAPRADATAPTAPPTAPPAPPTVPTLRGTGAFVGLAGHRGRGDGAIFRTPDGSNVLRLENFDIDNGPDLELYLVPGADRRAPSGDAHHFGGLRGNVGEQTYEIPAGYAVPSGPWTVLVWCEAFAVEFVAATVRVV